MKSSEVRLIQEARDRAMDVLMKCVTPYGFRASAEKAGTPRCGGATVWSHLERLPPGSGADRRRAGFAGDPGGLPLGLIPFNVNPDSGAISTENAGAVDSNLWFILGHCPYYKLTGDVAFVRSAWGQIQRHAVAAVPGHERVRPAGDPQAGN